MQRDSLPKYDDLQVNQFLGIFDGGFVTTNAGKATIKGFESRCHGGTDGEFVH